MKAGRFVHAKTILSNLRCGDRDTVLLPTVACFPHHHQSLAPMLRCNIPLGRRERNIATRGPAEKGKGLVKDKTTQWPSKAKTRSGGVGMTVPEVGEHRMNLRSIQSKTCEYAAPNQDTKNYDVFVLCHLLWLTLPSLLRHTLLSIHVTV